MAGRFFLFLLLAFAGTATTAQQQQKFPSDFWNEGKIVLEAGDTLKGLIKYSFRDEIIQLQVGNRVEAFTPRKAVYVEFFDQGYKRYRQIYSLPYSENGAYRAPIFFELLDEGKLTLLYRESLEYKTYSSAYYYGSYTRLVMVDKFFFLNDKGVITAFTGKKSELYDMMGSKGDEVKHYAKEERLNFDMKYGFAAIVHHYNTLVK